MELREFFAQVGGEYEEVLSRLPAEGMVKKFLRKFLDDPSYAALRQAQSEGRIEDAFRAAHTLKGLGMNLGLGDLAAAASRLTEALRAATELPAQQLFDEVACSYERAVESIEKLSH